MPRELEALGVDVVHDLPGVGEHLQDHLEVYIQYGSKQPVSVAPAMKWRNRPWVGFKWLFFRSGPGATNHFEAGGFMRGDEDVAYPNLMFHFLPVAIRYDGSSPGGRPRVPGPCRPDVLGCPRLGEDHLDRPARASRTSVQLPLDRAGPAGVARGRPLARTILTQPAFDPFNAGELSPGASVETDEEILDWVARDAETALHPSCTCRLGSRRDLRARPADDARARPRTGSASSMRPSFPT